MLKQRLFTAMILISITVAILFYLPPLAFCLLSGGVALIAAWEWSYLMGLKTMVARLFYLFIFTAILCISGFIFIPFILTVAFVWWLLATFLIFFYPSLNHWWMKSVFWRGLMGVIVLVPCWCALNFIRNLHHGEGVYTLLFLFMLVWGADSAAYFVGKRWGRTKFIPQVSPGKSLQGLYGATGLSIIVASTGLWVCQVPYSLWGGMILLALVTVLFSVAGDLFESMLKRQAGVKDSSQLLPGHGGFLDRIDSLTAAAPIFALGSILLTQH